MNSSQKDRLAYREQVARELGVLLDPPLSFRAAKFAAQHKTRADLVKWLAHPNTVNTWQMGRKTYTELCMAFGMAVPAKAPRTLGAQLAAAKVRIAELEQELAHFMELHGKDGMNKAGEAILLSTIKNLETLNENQAQVIDYLRIENSVQAAEIERLKGTLCSGGGGGKSTYQNGFTGATTSLPPETRITVNGKTFTLGEIDKEMTK